MTESGMPATLEDFGSRRGSLGAKENHFGCVAVWDKYGNHIHSAEAGNLTRRLKAATKVKTPVNWKRLAKRMSLARTIADARKIYNKSIGEEEVSELSKHHRELDRFGEGKCSVPMWQMGCPAGFCDRPAYGERPEGKTYRNVMANETMRIDGRYNGYVPALACVHHGGPKERAFMDGNKWCAVHPDFVNLQESVSGWGDTAEEARGNLLTQARK